MVGSEDGGSSLAIGLDPCHLHVAPRTKLRVWVDFQGEFVTFAYRDPGVGILACSVDGLHDSNRVVDFP